MESTNMEGKKRKRGKYSLKKVIDAINASAGIKTEIARKLNCDRTTLYRYIDKYPKVKAALEDKEEKVLDMAEGSLFALIQNGDFGAICYFLNNKGKKRGYAHPRDTHQNDDREKTDNRNGVLIAPGLLEDKAWEEAATVGTHEEESDTEKGHDR